MLALEAKCAELAGRNAQHIIKLVGIPEGEEEGRPTEFVSKLIPKLFGEDIFPQPVKVDRAHRWLQPPAPDHTFRRRSWFCAFADNNRAICPVAPFVINTGCFTPGSGRLRAVGGGSVVLALKKKNLFYWFYSGTQCLYGCVNNSVKKILLMNPVVNFVSFNVNGLNGPRKQKQLQMYLEGKNWHCLHTGNPFGNFGAKLIEKGLDRACDIIIF